MQDKTNNLTNYSSTKQPAHSHNSSMGKYSVNGLENCLPNQPIKAWSLAFAIGSVGTILSFPQIAQATLENNSTSNFNSSILGTPVLDLQNEYNPKEFWLHPRQEQIVKIPKIETRSVIELDVNSFTTVSIPELPSLILTQNNGSKNITKQIYTVRAGDTINSIARYYGISTAKIIEANEIKNPNQISINRRLVIPLEEPHQFTSPNKTAQVNTSETVAPISTRDISTNLTQEEEKQNADDRYISRLRADIDKLRNQFQSQYKGESQVSIDNASLTNREAFNSNYVNETVPLPSQEEDNLTSDDNLLDPEFRVSSAINTTNNYNSLFNNSLLQERLRPQLPPLSSPEEYLPDNSNIFNGYRWPAQGTFTSGYGWRWGRMHKGIDIAAPIGTPILAAATGEVIFAGWSSGGYGNLVKLKHPDGSVTFYAHNNRILVRRGQKIKQGQQIAEMGSTGYSTGPHLHFEIRTNGTTAVNPIALLPKR